MSVRHTSPGAKIDAKCDGQRGIAILDGGTRWAAAVPHRGWSTSEYDQSQNANQQQGALLLVQLSQATPSPIPVQS